MATNRNESWGECEILSSRKLSAEELEELRREKYHYISMEESVQQTVDRLIKEGANISNKSGLLTMDMSTLITIIEEYSEY